MIKDLKGVKVNLDTPDQVGRVLDLALRAGFRNHNYSSESVILNHTKSMYFFDDYTFIWSENNTQVNSHIKLKEVSYQEISYDVKEKQLTWGDIVPGDILVSTVIKGHTMRVKGDIIQIRERDSKEVFYKCKNGQTVWISTRNKSIAGFRYATKEEIAYFNSCTDKTPNIADMPRNHYPSSESIAKVFNLASGHRGAIMLDEENSKKELPLIKVPKI